MKCKTILVVALLALVGSGSVAAQSAADSAAIRATALDYIEGWYTGDAARMERALHPDLAKRIMMPNRSTGTRTLNSMTAEQLVAATARGGGKGTPEDERGIDVRILDIFEGASSVRVDAATWIDFLQIAKDGEGRWVIVNVLWELRPS